MADIPKLYVDGENKNIKDRTIILRGYISTTDPILANPDIPEKCRWYQPASVLDIPDKSFPWSVKVRSNDAWIDGPTYTPIDLDLWINIDKNYIDYRWINGEWKDIIDSSNLGDYASASDIDELNTTLENDYATKDAVNDLLAEYNRSIINNYATITSVNQLSETLGTDYATKDAVNSTLIDMNTSIVNTYATKTSVDLLSSSLDNYATKELFDLHKDTDVFRWNDAYNMQKDMIIGDAGSVGLMPNYAALVIDTVSTYTSTDQAGGLMSVSLINGETGYIIISINGTTVYSSEGLPPSINITKYFWLKQNETLTASIAAPIVYVPFIDDPESIFHIMETSLANTQAQVQQLQIQMTKIITGNLDTILDTTSTIDIETQSSSGGFTVTNPLGGQIIGTAGTYLLVGTGRIWVGDNLVFDNMGVSVGVNSKSYVQDVRQGDIITSEAMTSLTYTDYIAKPS